MATMMSLDEFKGTPSSAEDAIEQLVLANRILANEGVVDAFGHVSIRNPANPDTFFQSRSLSPERVTREDILEIDLDGNVITPRAPRAYGERIIHAAVLRARPEVNGVFHGHPREVLPFACTGTPLRPIVHLGCLFYEGIPLYDDYDVSAGMLISSPEEGERVARALGKARALLLRGHGCVVVGENIPALVLASIYLRDNAAVQLAALSLGQPKYLSYEEGRAASRVTLSAAPLQRAWDYWVGRARKAMPDLAPRGGVSC